MAKDPTNDPARSDASSSLNNSATPGIPGSPTPATTSSDSVEVSPTHSSDAAGSATTGKAAKKPTKKPARPAAGTKTPGTKTTGAKQPPVVQGSIAGGTWIALIAGALLLIVLLVFIMQNQNQVDLVLFAWNFRFPAGIGFLLAAIGGALIMALVGGVRMFQLRRQIIKTNKNLVETAETAQAARAASIDESGEETTR